MNNLELIRALSASSTEKILQSVGLKMLQNADDSSKVEMWKFWKPFREFMKNCFSLEDSINGNTFELRIPKEVEKQLCKIKYEQICKKVEEIFGVSSIVIKKKDFPLDFNVSDLKNTTYHIPFIIAYDLSVEELFSLLTKIGDNANIIWIHKEM